MPGTPGTGNRVVWTEQVLVIEDDFPEKERLAGAVFLQLFAL